MDDENRIPPPERKKAPIDWAKWIAAIGAVVGAIATVIRSLRGD